MEEPVSAPKKKYSPGKAPPLLVAVAVLFTDWALLARLSISCNTPLDFG